MRDEETTALQKLNLLASGAWEKEADWNRVSVQVRNGATFKCFLCKLQCFQ